MGQSWAVWVPEGPGKNGIYARHGARTFLTREALAWRNCIAAELGDEACLSGLVKVWLHHFSSGQGVDDIDHQLVAVLDGITAAGGWLDDKQVQAVEVLRTVVPLAESGVLVIAQELSSWEELFS